MGFYRLVYFCVLAIWILLDFTHGLSGGPSLPQKAKTTKRRQVLSKISTVAASTGFLSAGFGPVQPPPALAAEDFSFVSYKVIPDASDALDPRLVRLDNKSFLSSLATGKAGGAVWLGEHHNSANDHMFQAEFIRSMHGERERKRIEAPMVIGLEQVQIQFQSVLDEFVSGTISLEEMKRSVDWDTRWRWPFEGYQPIFEAARSLRIPLLALNVDSEDLAKVEKEGYPGLPKDRLRLYIKDPIVFGELAKERQFSTYVNYVIFPSYEIHQRLGLLRYAISGERLQEEMSFRNFLSGRILWDEGMAGAAHSWSEANPGGLMIGLVGADHIKFRNGIPGRFARLAKDTRDCTSVIINPTLIDSRPSGSVANVGGSDSSQFPDRITLQLRYLKDNVDASSEATRPLPQSTGGVMPFADYIVVS